MRIIQLYHMRFSFRCDLKNWCKRQCPELSSGRGFCLIRNLTHDIKCCLKDGCNLEEMPIFAVTEEKFSFLPGFETLAATLTPIIILIFIIYPIVSALVRGWIVTKHSKIEYNPTFDPELPKKDGIVFKDAPPKLGEPLDGCLSLDEFAEVMKAMAGYHGSEDDQAVVTPIEAVTYVSYEIHESLGFDYAIIVRSEPTKFESLLIRMIEQGPGFFKIEGSELYELLSEVSEIFRSESSLLEIPADVVVIGEIRGRYSDLLRWFQLYGYPPKRRYLFLGGIIDQECAESIETLAFLAAYKITTPHHIYMIRGATEFFPFQIQKRFPLKLSSVLSAFIMRICSEMPIAATIGNKILAVHSGISSKLKNLDAIKKIDRPPMKWNCRIPYDLALGMPTTEIQMYKRIKGGRGYLFGEKAIEEFVVRLQLALIIRTRTPYEKGHFSFASNRLLTIWSSNCNDVKLATSLYIDSQLHVSIHSMTPVVVKTISSIRQLPSSLETDENFVEVKKETKSNVEKSLGMGEKVVEVKKEKKSNVEKSLGKDEKAVEVKKETKSNVEKSLGKDEKVIEVKKEKKSNLEESLGTEGKFVGVKKEKKSNVEESLGTEGKFVGVKKEKKSNFEESLGTEGKFVGVKKEKKSKVEKNSKTLQSKKSSVITNVQSEIRSKIQQNT